MKRIFRYDLYVSDTTQVKIPRDAEILKFAARAQEPGSVEFWAIVDEAAEMEQRLFRVLGTGHPFPDRESWSYLDTVITAHGALVWHVFEGQV